jgi:hypothetical protein
MGNACAQDCNASTTEVSIEKNQVDDPQDCVVLYSQRTGRAQAGGQELPRLGLTKQQGLTNTFVDKECHKPTPSQVTSSLFGSVAPPAVPTPQAEGAAPKVSTIFVTQEQQMGTPLEAASSLLHSPTVPLTTIPEVVASGSSTSEDMKEMAATSENIAPFLEIVFEVDGEDTGLSSIRIARRPLGAEFSKHSSGSAMVKKVQAQSYASELGLQAGWIVKSVDGYDMSVNSFKQVQDIIQSSVSRLPVQH